MRLDTDVGELGRQLLARVQVVRIRSFWRGFVLLAVYVAIWWGYSNFYVTTAHIELQRYHNLQELAQNRTQELQRLAQSLPKAQDAFRDAWSQLIDYERQVPRRRDLPALIGWLIDTADANGLTDVTPTAQPVADGGIGSVTVQVAARGSFSDAYRFARSVEEGLAYAHFIALHLDYTSPSAESGPAAPPTDGSILNINVSWRFPLLPDAGLESLPDVASTLAPIAAELKAQSGSEWVPPHVAAPAKGATAWSRDPFTVPAGVWNAYLKSRTASQMGRLRLLGTAHAGSDWVALIDNGSHSATLHVGDAIGGFKVVAIDSGGVTLQAGEIRATLSFEGETP